MVVSVAVLGLGVTGVATGGCPTGCGAVSRGADVTKAPAPKCCGVCSASKAAKATASPAPHGHAAHHAHAAKLAVGLKQIDAAIAAVKDGRSKDALAALAKARAAVVATHKALVAAHKPAVANARCPIMGSKIDPGKVPANLTREFDGRKVGFCCAACPPAWDKMPDAAKRAKLQAVMPKAPGK